MNLDNKQMKIGKNDDVIAVHAMKAYRGCRGMAPRIVNLGTSWRWVVNFMPRLLFSIERPPISITWEAGWAPEPVWTFLGKDKYIAPTGIRIVDSSARNLVIISTKWGERAGILMRNVTPFRMEGRTKLHGVMPPNTEWYSQSGYLKSHVSMYTLSICGSIKPTPNWADPGTLHNDINPWVWSFSAGSRTHSSHTGGLRIV